MRRIFKPIVLILLVAALSACQSKPKEAESKTLVVYTPHPAEKINLAVKEFEEKTGITVEVVAAGTGELLKRVETEAGSALGDVMWGGGAESLAAYKEYFTPYKSSELSAISSSYYDPEYYWLGESPLPMVIMYNTNLVAESSAPKSWSDVLKPEFKGKIAMADPAKSGSAYTIMVTMVTAYGGDTPAGWDFVTSFNKNLDGKILSSSSSVYKGVSDGEYSIGLTLEKEAIKYVTNGSPVKIVYPSEGTSAVPDGVALIKGAKNETNAKKFIDFVLSKDTQTTMSEQLQLRSIRNDVSAPTGLGKLSDIKLVDYDFDWASTKKDDILDHWKNIVVGN